MLRPTKAIHYSDWRVQLVLTSNTDHVTWWTLEHVEIQTHSCHHVCRLCAQSAISSLWHVGCIVAGRFDRQDHPLQRMISTAWVLHIAHIHIRSRSSIYIQYAHHRHTVIPSRIQTQEQSQLVPFEKQETPNLSLSKLFLFSFGSSIDFRKESLIEKYKFAFLCLLGLCDESCDCMSNTCDCRDASEWCVWCFDRQGDPLQRLTSTALAGSNGTPCNMMATWACRVTTYSCLYVCRLCAQSAISSLWHVGCMLLALRPTGPSTAATDIYSLSTAHCTHPYP